ncbi:MAG: hypothetical protein ACXVRW_07770 [Solirubrobacteraceae bacterium]
MLAPLAVDLRALRVLVGPDIKIVPGRAVMARVVAPQQPGGRGSLSIAGYLLEAELPESVRAGDDLRLVVKDVSAERVLLAVSDRHDADSGQQAQQAQAEPIHPQGPDPALAQPPVPLPGGGSLQVTERDAGGRGATRPGERQDVLLRYNAPALGAVDLRFQMDAGALNLGVSLAPGRPLELARADAESLRQALEAAMPGRAVSVTVTSRHEPLDVYA